MPINTSLNTEPVEVTVIRGCVQRDYGNTAIIDVTEVVSRLEFVGQLVGDAVTR